MSGPTASKSCCASKDTAGSGHTSTASAAVTPKMVDPVCGMSVSPDSAHHSEHAGRHYAFCSAGCRTKFEADPTRYVDEHGLRRVAVAATASTVPVGHDHANQTTPDHAQGHPHAGMN